MESKQVAIQCDSEDCVWCVDGACARCTVQLREYKIRNRMGDRIAVVCTHRMVSR